MPARGARRTTVGGLNRKSELVSIVKERMANDRHWNFYTQDGRWICPYCLSAVRPPSKEGSRNSANLPRSIERHLSNRCAAYQAGRGQYQPLEALQLQVQHEDIANLAMNDPAWRVFDHEGYWYSPCSLLRVPDVRILNRRFDNFTVQQMVRHVSTCQNFLRGEVHPIEAVQKARDHGIRIAKLANDIAKLLGHPVWRYRDSAGYWICPYCLTHVTTVRVTDERQWPDVVQEMARFLLEKCPSFGPGQNQIQDEAQVQAAAAQPPPTLPGGAPPPAAPYQRTRSGQTPIATPIGISSQIASDDDIPIAAPVSDDEVPVARPVTGTQNIPIAPEYEDHPSSDDLVPQVIPGQTPAAIPVAEEVVEAPQTGIFGEVGSDPLAGSFLDQELDVQIQSESEDSPSESFDDLVQGQGFPDASSSDGFPTAAAVGETETESEGEGDPFTWMDELAATVDEESRKVDSVEENTDLLRARDVQINMLRKEPTIPGFQFGSRFESCSEVSGDFYEYIPLRDGRIGFAQGDVSGHGMQAGLIMSMAKKVLTIYGKQLGSPKEVLASVNEALVEDLQGKMFVSMTYGILDPSAREIIWARAGHNPTIHFNLHTRELKEINPPGMVVGMKGGPLFAQVGKEVTTTLQSGDLFLIYTDGVTETMNRQGEEYGVELLQELVVQHANENLEVLLDRILDSVRSFRGGQETQDDMTLTALLVD